MGVLSGPLLSLTASGTIGKTLTYSHWRGIKYVRSRVVPANPDTDPQKAIRAVFANMSRYWTQGADPVRDPWLWAAKGRPLTDRNLLAHANIHNLYTDSDLTRMIISPGTGGVAAPILTSMTGGVGTATAIFAYPDDPDGFAVDNSLAILINEGDPTTLLPMITYLNANGGASPVTIVVNVPAGNYHYGLYTVYDSTSGPDRVAYTPSIIGSVTVT